MACKNILSEQDRWETKIFFIYPYDEKTSNETDKSLFCKTLKHRRLNTHSLSLYMLDIFTQEIVIKTSMTIIITYCNYEYEYFNYIVKWCTNTMPTS
jgi:hypothetical protein